MLMWKIISPPPVSCASRSLLPRTYLSFRPIEKRAKAKDCRGLHPTAGPFYFIQPAFKSHGRYKLLNPYSIRFRLTPTWKREETIIWPDFLTASLFSHLALAFCIFSPTCQGSLRYIENLLILVRQRQRIQYFSLNVFPMYLFQGLLINVTFGQSENKSLWQLCR